jgi:2-keto-4-pentenoate hydratase/2-oxohepta-3-ene-1,7-dioic acid hydratase in catechol pathway
MWMSIEIKSSRREFLMAAAGTSLAGIAAAAGTSGAETDAPSGAATAAGPSRRRKPSARSHDMPRGLRLLSIRSEHGDTLGVKTDRGILDVRRASLALHLPVPLTLDDLLQEGGAPELAHLIAAAQKSRHAESLYVDEAQITHGRLFSTPGKIVCIGLNYRDHAKETGDKVPSVPILFNKYNNALTSHGATIRLPTDVATKFDYEVEMLVVIGRRAHDVNVEDASKYVAGYCTSNDFSARDLQLELDGHQWMIGKTLDDFAPIGPYFVCADLVEDPNNLNIECRVNGETRQHSNTSSLVYNTEFLVSYISRHFPLEPGDLIFTGTPPGVILGMPKEKQVWLKAGDQIACSVGNLGELRFTLA